jgi:DNA helicase HerA-like ATPase
VLIVQLHGYALRGEQPRRLTRMMVFDEAHRVKDSKRLESLAREGRAFGIGIIIGTQFPGDIPESMAGNLATQLFLMNNQANHRRFVVAQLLGTTSTSEAHQLLDELSRLKPLEGIFSNAHHKGLLVRVLPHYERQAKL